MGSNLKACMIAMLSVVTIGAQQQCAPGSYPRMTRNEVAGDYRILQGTKNRDIIWKKNILSAGMMTAEDELRSLSVTIKYERLTNDCDFGIGFSDGNRTLLAIKNDNDLVFLSHEPIFDGVLDRFVNEHTEDAFGKKLLEQQPLESHPLQTLKLDIGVRSSGKVSVSVSNGVEEVKFDNKPALDYTKGLSLFLFQHESDEIQIIHSITMCGETVSGKDLGSFDMECLMMTYCQPWAGWQIREILGRDYVTTSDLQVLQNRTTEIKAQTVENEQEVGKINHNLLSLRDIVEDINREFNEAEDTILTILANFTVQQTEQDNIKTQQAQQQSELSETQRRLAEAEEEIVNLKANMTALLGMIDDMKKPCVCEEKHGCRP
eukprot:m.342415 g.342415  ORF g.342415 m.342415 type:complete len:376 (+) comp21358_c0_seq1:127-1254(+)